MNIGKAIRTLRLKRGLSQRRLAERCFVSTYSISRLETGKAHPPKNTVERLCRALGVPVAYLYLLGIEESDFPAGKSLLFRLQLVPLCNELLEEGES
jgi:transcriptional regulator with XRE-family HTH domain